MPQKYILLAITVLSTFILRSQSNSLVIFSASGNPFLLTVDQVKINSIPQSDLKATDLSFGWHQVEITFPSTAKDSVFKDSILFINEPKYADKEFTYALTKDSKKSRLKFISVSERSGPAKPVVPEAPKATGPVVDNSKYGNLYKASDNKPVFFKNYDPETASCKIALTEKDLQFALGLLTKINDEERRSHYMQEIIRWNCYTASQLATLLNIFPSEIDRLAFAKLAYTHISDKKNTMVLLPSLNYQSIKDNYTLFIKEQESLSQQKKANCTQPLDDAAFNELLINLKNLKEEAQKLSAIKQAVVKQCFSLTQLQLMTRLFTHDREKLACLKQCYPALTTKEAAASLAAELQFEETKTEFSKFISKP